MSEQIKKSLSSFMKKQIDEKSSKKNSTTNSLANSLKNKFGAETESEKNLSEEEKKEKEELNEAKKASRAKAANFDQSGMIKKLMLESIAKYTLMITLLVICAIGVIEIGPKLLESLHGLIGKLLLKSLSR